MFENLKNSISYVVVGIGRYAWQAIYDRLDDKTKAIIICILSIIIQLSKMCTLLDFVLVFPARPRRDLDGLRKCKCLFYDFYVVFCVF